MLGPLLEFVRTAIQDTILSLGYVGIALVMFAGNILLVLAYVRLSRWRA